MLGLSSSSRPRPPGLPDHVLQDDAEDGGEHDKDPLEAIRDIPRKRTEEEHSGREHSGRET